MTTDYARTHIAGVVVTSEGGQRSLEAQVLPEWEIRYIRRSLTPSHF